MTARMFSPILPNLILLKARHLNLFNKSLTITDPDHDKYKLRYATCIITPVTGNLDTDNEVLAAGPCSLAISSINVRVKECFGKLLFSLTVKSVH
eukprot:m.279572 g.279572  ORF g.279572 m.279572 type:complete len:95 (+) comp40624_c1_seq13:3332-3616(+)